MRTDIFSKLKGFHWFQRLGFAILKLLVGETPGPFIMMTYRRELFGKPFATALHDAMRDSKEWKKEEVELFAAFTASRLECGY